MKSGNAIGLQLNLLKAQVMENFYKIKNYRLLIPRSFAFPALPLSYDIESKKVLRKAGEARSAMPE